MKVEERDDLSTRGPCIRLASPCHIYKRESKTGKISIQLRQSQAGIRDLPKPDPLLFFPLIFLHQLLILDLPGRLPATSRMESGRARQIIVVGLERFGNEGEDGELDKAGGIQVPPVGGSEGVVGR
jgi:hypothetical protein